MIGVEKVINNLREQSEYFVTKDLSINDGNDYLIKIGILLKTSLLSDPKIPGALGSTHMSKQSEAPRIRNTRLAITRNVINNYV